MTDQQGETQDGTCSWPEQDILDAWFVHHRKELLDHLTKYRLKRQRRAEEAERWAEKLAKILIPLWEWSSTCDYISDPNRTHKECDCPLCVSRKGIYEYAVWKKSRE